MAGRIGMRRWEPDMQRKEAGLDSETEERQPKQRRQSSLIAHRPEIPASGARRQKGKECKKTKCARMGSRQIQPTGSSRFALLAVEGDCEIGADGEKLPCDQKVQPVGYCQHQSHACLLYT